MPTTREQKPESVQYQLFILILSGGTLLTLTAETLLRPTGEVRQLLAYGDTAVCALFLVDFLITLRRAPDRWRYFYTWGWLDLLSSIPTADVARWGRAARAARIFRVLRGVRATKLLGQVLLERRAQSAFLAAALFALLLILVASITMLQVEVAAKSNIKTAEDALWWALTTVTTVGYGDRYPVTHEGRLVAGLLMCAGVGLFGTFSGFLAAWFVAPGAQQDRSDVEALKDEVRKLRELIERRTELLSAPASADRTHDESSASHAAARTGETASNPRT